MWDGCDNKPLGLRFHSSFGVLHLQHHSLHLTWKKMGRATWERLENTKSMLTNVLLGLFTLWQPSCVHVSLNYSTVKSSLLVYGLKGLRLTPLKYTRWLICDSAVWSFSCFVRVSGFWRLFVNSCYTLVWITESSWPSYWVIISALVKSKVVHQ